VLVITQTNPTSSGSAYVGSGRVVKTSSTLYYDANTIEPQHDNNYFQLNAYKPRGGIRRNWWRGVYTFLPSLPLPCPILLLLLPLALKAPQRGSGWCPGWKRI